MRFSVIIPVYNVAPWLPECLASLRAQTWLDWEGLCVDDGSTETTGALLVEAVRAEPRLHAVFQPHVGASRARNRMLERVQGDAVTFLDGDDAVAPWWLAEAERLLRETKADLVRFGVPPRRAFPGAFPSPHLHYKPRGAGSSPLAPGAFPSPHLHYKVLQGADAILSWGWPAFYRAGYSVLSVLRKEIVKRVQFPDVPIREDTLFGFALLPLLHTVCLSPSVHYFYRARPNSLVASPHPTISPLAFLRALRSFLPPHHPTIRRVLAMSAFTAVVDWLCHPAMSASSTGPIVRAAWLKTVGALGLFPVKSLAPHWRIVAMPLALWGWQWPVVLYARLLRCYGQFRARIRHG